ncbi:hypothetical protein MHK_002739 [Candidatus Magnetomorum sp. HK-1]|nr:hypothetical protein MHK_002739 [Candidatus Magnetomorum sp. HK-1]
MSDFLGMRPLETSISYEPTTRAKQYLNIARKSWVELNSTDKKPPKINIFSPYTNSWTNQASVIVHGEVIDETYIQNVKVNNKDVFIDVSQTKIQIWETIPLDTGKNTITIIASDIVGNTSTCHLIVNVDIMGPVFSIDNSNKLFAYDNHGIDEIIINAQRIKGHGQKEIQIDLPEKQCSITVKDISGNITSSSYIPNNNLSHLIASNNSFWLTKKFNTRQINITKPEQMNNNIIHEVYVNKIIIEGNIKGSNVKKLFFNKNEVGFSGKTNNFFSFIYHLKPGRNGLSLRALDSHGNVVADKQIKITKKEVSFRQIDYRLKVAFEYDKNHFFINRLVNPFIIIINKNNRFNYINNKRKADCILSFTIDNTNTYLGILTTVKDKDYNVPIASVDDYMKKMNPSAPITLQQINLMLNKIYVDLENAIPLYEGKVIDVIDAERIITNLGKMSGIFSNMKILVFNEEENLLSARAIISEIDDLSSYARIKKKLNTIRSDDYVITQ